MVKPWGKADYQKLLEGVITALLDKEVDVRIIVHRIFKFPKGFPKGVRTYVDIDHTEHRCKALKVLKWLQGIGFTSITTEQISAHAGALTMKERELFREYP